MEYILMAEKIQQQSESEPEPEPKNQFKSVFAVNGQKILAPLMTPERRLEMQKLRQAAIDIQQKISRHDVKPYTRQARGAESTNAPASKCSRTRNAGTNTEIELELVLRPLTVAGRINQTLQLSETLIFDNTSNSIVKFIKPKFSRKTSTEHHEVHDEATESSNQQSMIMVPPAEPGKLSNISLEATEHLSKRVIRAAQSQPVVASAAQLSRKLEEIRKNGREPPRVESLRQLLGVAMRRENEPVDYRITSPLLRHMAKRSESLHPPLWTRYDSYPFSFGSAVKHTAEPEAFNAMTSSLKSALTLKQPSTMIQVEQQHSTSVEQAQVPNQPKSESLQSKRVNSSKSFKRTTRPRSGISYTAHASSHDTVQQDGKDGNKRISSTQRRLNYDPRASLKRGSTLKKTNSSSSCAAMLSLTTSSSNSNCIATASSASESSNSEMVKSQLREMEEQQRQRFQLLVSQQTEERKRMQKEFLAQQQTLMNQMISDMARLTYDKDTQSETSSVNSLPQSPIDLQIDETETDV